MTRVVDIGAKYENLPKVLLEYDTELNKAEDILELKGKNLEVANREQPAWLLYYDQKRAELKTLNNILEVRLKKVRGKLFRSYNENSSQELSDRAKEKYIDNEEAYLNLYEIYLEVNETYEKYVSVVNAFQARGFILNNITKIRVASIEDAEIY